MKNRKGPEKAKQNVGFAPNKSFGDFVSPLQGLSRIRRAHPGRCTGLSSCALAGLAFALLAPSPQPTLQRRGSRWLFRSWACLWNL